jgi:hypothetical protein
MAMIAGYITAPAEVNLQDCYLLLSDRGVKFLVEWSGVIDGLQLHFFTFPDSSSG